MSARPVWALWYGGPSYSYGGTLGENVETFPSVRAAVDACTDREGKGHWEPQDFTYADGRHVSVLTPCVEDSEMDLWFADPRDMSDPYPDRIITRGPRGGWRVTPA